VKLLCFCLFTFAFLLSSACRPAAAPVSVSNKPVSINDRPQTNLPLPPRKPLEEMTWAGDDGKTQKLKDLQGKAVILDFWATNCPPCVEEIPHLMALQQKYGADNLVLIGLHVGDDEDRALIPAFSRTHNINYPIAFPDDDLSRFVFSDGDTIPRTLIIDRSGAIVKRTVGYGSGIQKDLDAAAETAVAAQ
jgi:thiol-disulfide isomerase/thioredoxin